MPISSRLVAADSIWNCAAKPAFFTKSFMTYSAIGLRQILPWQTNKIFFISRCLPIIIFAFSIANEPPARREKICKKDSVSRQNIRETEPFQKIISLPSFERRSSFKKVGYLRIDGGSFNMLTPFPSGCCRKSEQSLQTDLHFSNSSYSVSIHDIDKTTRSMVVTAE